jgi:hypothetical protein
MCYACSNHWNSKMKQERLKWNKNTPVIFSCEFSLTVRRV